MATTVTLTAVIKEAAPSTRVLVRFADGVELEFASLAQLQEWAREPDLSVTLTQKLCVAYTLARSETLTNLASTQGKSFTFDLTSNNPIRVQ
jgi:hypothetical protein